MLLRSERREFRSRPSKLICLEKPPRSGVKPAIFLSRLLPYQRAAESHSATAPTTTRSTFKSSQSIAKMKNCTFIVPDALLPSFESVAATKIFEEKEALALIGSASLS